MVLGLYPFFVWEYVHLAMPLKFWYKFVCYTLLLAYTLVVMIGHVYAGEFSEDVKTYIAYTEITLGVILTLLYIGSLFRYFKR